MDTDTSQPVRLQIHGRHTSYNVQKVLWLADELALEYTHFEVGGRFGGNTSDAFLAMNPHGKVPVLRDNNLTVWESNTILRYLADTYAPGVWISKAPFDRTLVDRWLDWSADRLEPAFVSVFWGYYRTPEMQRNPGEIATAVRRCEDCLSALGAQLKAHDFLTGGIPTLADIATGVYLYRLKKMELPIVFPENIDRWYGRLSPRRGYRRWVMSDFSELRGRVDY